MASPSPKGPASVTPGQRARDGPLVHHQSDQPDQDAGEVPPQRQATVTPLTRDGVAPRTGPIAGCKPGWVLRADRMIIHYASKDGPASLIGTVPEVTGRVTYRMSDGRHTRIAYQLDTPQGPRIVSADEILDGTWADRCGRDRPVGPDERHAYARVLSESVRAAPEMPAIPVKDSKGGIMLPGADAQELGYLRTGDPDTEGALTAWQRVMRLAMAADRTTLPLSAMFVGPLVSSLHGVPAHILNLQGTGQEGKSTAQQVACALIGDPSAETAELFGSMNSTGMALPEALIEARYLPMCREETSSSGMALPDLEKLFSRIVAGGKRSRLGKGNKRQEGVGTWHSIFMTSSNESLLRPGQVESLASRLVQLHPPFFADADASAEAIGLALQYYGWPLVWARDAGMLDADHVARWRALHTEIVNRLASEDAQQSGGIPLTLIRIVAAWCVGAYMIGEVLGLPEVGTRCEEDAKRELPRILEDTTETHRTAGQVLWEAVAGAIATEHGSWVSSHVLTHPTERDVVPRRVLGYFHDRRVYVYVNTLKDVARQAGIDSTVPGLKEMQKKGVLITTERAKLASKHPTSHLRSRIPGKAYIFDTERAQSAWADREAPPVVLPPDPVSPDDDSATAASEARATLGSASPNHTPVARKVAPAGESRGAMARRHDVTTPLQTPPRPTHPPRVYPEAIEDVTDRAFASLVNRAVGRTRAATRFGVLGDGWLYLPNREPVPVPMPRYAAEVPELAAAYGLKTVWVHASAMAALGLPSHEERRALGTAQERAAQGLTDDAPVKAPGAMNPVAHQWVELPAEGSRVAEVVPAGVSAWMTLRLADESASDRRLIVAVPAYETRFDKAKQPGRGGFGAAPTPGELLDALMVYLLSTLHGTQERPKVVPYYMSPNHTGEDFAGGRGRTDVVCQAVRDKAVPPAAQGLRIMPLMVPQQWHRQPTEQETAAGWLHRFDKTAAWLAAYGPTKLGIGEPTHGAEGTPYNKGLAGYWRLADVPGKGLDGLPKFDFREVPEGGYWLPTPSVELLRELYPDWTPRVLESWHWETSKAALSGMYKLLSTSRTRIVEAIEAGRPGAKWAKQVHGRIYQSFRGYLDRQEVRTDRETGRAWDTDIYFRPDWAHMLIAHATANLYRNLAKFKADGAVPLSVYVDAVTYASDSPDPHSAKPGSMTIGVKGGTWSIEGQAPMTEVAQILSDPQHKTGAHGALDLYLSEKGE